jgi:hypothetical protein
MIFKQFCRIRTRRTPLRNVLVSSVSVARSWDTVLGGILESVDVRIRDTGSDTLETSESAVLCMNETEAREVIRKIQAALTELEKLRASETT